jgi:hypothetical protein
VQLKAGGKAVIAEGVIIKDIVSYGPVKVPAGGFVVVASASANVFYGNKIIDSFSVGQQVSWTWEIASPSGYNFNDVYFAVGSDTAKINGAGGASRPYIGSNNYFKLRDVGQALDFGVDRDSGRNAIFIRCGESYTSD